MAKYRCIQRLTTDNHKTIHEVGDIVELSDSDAQVALRASAVVLVADTQGVTQAPTVTQLKSEVDTLQHQIDVMDHEGGVAQ